MNCELELSLHSIDLSFEKQDPGLELFDREGVEILLADKTKWIVRLVREKLVEVH